MSILCVIVSCLAPISLSCKCTLSTLALAFDATVSRLALVCTDIVSIRAPSALGDPTQLIPAIVATQEATGKHTAMRYMYLCDTALARSIRVCFSGGACRERFNVESLTETPQQNDLVGLEPRPSQLAARSRRCQQLPTLVPWPSLGPSVHRLEHPYGP